MIAAAMLTGAAPAAGPGLQAVESLQPGRWVLRETGANPSPPRAVCLPDDRRLIQIRHPDEACSHFVIENEPLTATIHYSCRGAGHGRTMIVAETPRHIRVETQGATRDGPFKQEFDGQRLGDC